MNNPRHLTSSGEIVELVNVFCKEHGLIRKCFVDEALKKHLSEMELTLVNKS